jgi:ParB family chromosome partitioning protein
MAAGETKKSTKADNVQPSGLTFARVASVEPTPTDRWIPIERIIKGDRLRTADPAAVEAKRISMRESGQISPILVRHAPDQPGWYVLVAGLHRLEAAIAEDWESIRADVRQLTDDEARLIEVDENLISKGLTPLERAIFVDVRLQVWGRLHPERVVRADAAERSAAPKRGRPANSAKLTEFLGDTPATMGFSAETAEDLGFSPSTVERALRIARGLSTLTLAKIAGTKIAKNEGMLRQLAAVPDKSEQLRAAEALVSEQAKTFPDALVIATGKTPAPEPAPRPVDETVAAFMAIWKKAPPTHRAAILHKLSGEKLPGAWTVMERADG